MEPIEQLTNEAQQIRLGAEASSRMRDRILAHMRSHPAPIRSPYQRFVHLFHLPLAALMLVLLVGAGGATSYAALGSLPGDALYPIKVGVIEPVETALAFSPQAKAALQVSLAERRVSEEVKLAAKNKLTPEQGVMLKDTFDQSLGSAKATIATLSAQDPETAAKLKKKLADDLDAHEAALTGFAVSSTTATTTAVEARAFAEHIKKRVHLLDDLEATSTPEDAAAHAPSHKDESDHGDEASSTPELPESED